jgi:Flp pilus assembly pilin Flp
VDVVVLRAWLRARFAGDERGANLVEYGMLLIFIAIVALVAVRALGTNVSAHFVDVSASLN